LLVGEAVPVVVRVYVVADAVDRGNARRFIALG
jgi:hypothetical protein